MESKTALAQLSALAQENRLALFRLLIKAGPDGLPAGEIAAALGVPPNTLSAQLALLSNAGLIEGTRQGRSIIYTAQYDAISGLIVFLMEDCCQGRSEVCAPVLEAAQSRCC
ncbi:MAG: transcriptional regulator [Hyphomonas sp. 34-62-18]|nr:metalloregulator ArsR/SmtB family transcription factor [Hyphomonas sp. 34-62-18]OZB12394.1 MAG: transcriptional regulator [Hyphomonas sp. 34-62-18]